MVKKLIKNVFVCLIICLSVFFYLVYLGQNKFSLMFNQGIRIPDNLEDISITRRRGVVSLLSGYDAYGSASGRIKQESFLEWLKKSDFKVISCLPTPATTPEYYTSFHSLPVKILNNNIEYHVQFETDNPKSISVKLLDAENILLEFSSDWN